jgi:hypothetical protein
MACCYCGEPPHIVAAWQSLAASTAETRRGEAYMLVVHCLAVLAGWQHPCNQGPAAVATHLGPAAALSTEEMVGVYTSSCPWSFSSFSQSTTFCKDGSGHMFDGCCERHLLESSTADHTW